MGNYSNYAEEMSKKYSNINYFGVIDYEKALELYANCDVMIGMYDPKIKNYKCATPNKIYESINLGKSIIFTKQVGLSNLVEKENFGWLVGYNFYSFMKLVEKITIDEVAQKSNNVTLLRNKYSWENVKKDIIILTGKAKPFWEKAETTR